VACVNKRLLFYNTITGAGAIAQVNVDGTFGAVASDSPLSPGWTHIVADPKNSVLMFYNSNSPSAYTVIGRLDQTGVYTDVVPVQWSAFCGMDGISWPSKRRSRVDSDHRGCSESRAFVAVNAQDRRACLGDGRRSVAEPRLADVPPATRGGRWAPESRWHRSRS
jgi:hypothetical protein